MIPEQETPEEILRDSRVLLTSKHAGKPVIEGLLRALLKPAEALEALTFEVIEKRRLDVAEGVQLDVIGAIVGEAREGRSDEDYRAAIRLRIRINRSKGRTRDVLDVTALSLGPTGWTYRDVELAAFIVTAYELGAPVAKALRAALAKTRAAGTQGVFVTSTWPLAQNFSYGDTEAGGVGTGMPDESDPDEVKRVAALSLG